MHTARGYVLGLALIFGVTFGAPVALSGVEALGATAALTLFVDDAAAQTVDCPGTGGAGGAASPIGVGIGNGGAGGPATTNCNQLMSDNEAGDGGNATSSSGNGGRGGNGNGGLALMHELISTTATSETPLSLEDVSTGDLHNERTVNVEPTDETVIINMAGNPGSNGIHPMNVGAPVQSINTAGIISSADAAGIGGNGGASGDATSTGGNGGDARQLLP
jgi:hypothetical protein